MLRNFLRLVCYLIFSVFIGIAVTLVMDSFENVAVEKRIRTELREGIMAAAVAFKKSAVEPSTAQVIAFVKGYTITVLKGKVRVGDSTQTEKPSDTDYSFLFSYREASEKVDFYIVKSFLKDELAVLEKPELIFGIFTTILLFSGIVFYAEKKKQVVALQQNFEVRHTEIKKVLEEHEALALLGRMTATLAHELKTPIATISNLVQVLPSRIADEHFVSRFLALTRAELQRTEQLIGNLLAFGKDFEVVTGAWIPLAPFLAGLADTLELKVVCSPSLEVNGDRFYLELLFENLLRNSRTEGAREIRVGVQTTGAGDGVEVSLEDDGGGFPPHADLDTLLSPFVTTHSSGTGLGLFLAGKIIAAHGGGISLYRPAHGAGVRLTFPAKSVRWHA